MPGPPCLCGKGQPWPGVPKALKLTPGGWTSLFLISVLLTCKITKHWPRVTPATALWKAKPLKQTMPHTDNLEMGKEGPYLSNMDCWSRTLAPQEESSLKLQNILEPSQPSPSCCIWAALSVWPPSSASVPWVCQPHLQTFPDTV